MDQEIHVCVYPVLDKARRGEKPGSLVEAPWYERGFTLYEWEDLFCFHPIADSRCTEDGIKVFGIAVGISRYGHRLIWCVDQRPDFSCHLTLE